MKNITQKARIAGITFKEGFKMQAKSEDTMATSFTVGAIMALKYGGSLERGVKNGVGFYIALSSLNGVKSVVENWDTIERLSKVED